MGVLCPLLCISCCDILVQFLIQLREKCLLVVHLTLLSLLHHSRDKLKLFGVRHRAISYILIALYFLHCNYVAPIETVFEDVGSSTFASVNGTSFGSVLPRLESGLSL